MQGSHRGMGALGFSPSSPPPQKILFLYVSNLCKVNLGPAVWFLQEHALRAVVPPPPLPSKNPYEIKYLDFDIAGMDLMHEVWGRKYILQEWVD
jgi:hypothetical protein